MAAEKGSETAMLVIDMQNDFILPGGPMHVAGGHAIVPSVIRAVSLARQRGIFVIWVVREHDPWGRDVELFRRHLYVNGEGPTAKGSKGAQLVDGLIPEEKDYKIVKTRFSAFFDTHLHHFLQTSGIKNLVIVGVQTPNCIRQTVYDAVALNYQSVTVIVDATAAATPEVHIANIMDMKNIGVETPTLEEWLQQASFSASTLKMDGQDLILVYIQRWREQIIAQCMIATWCSLVRPALPVPSNTVELRLYPSDQLDYLFIIFVY